MDTAPRAAVPLESALLFTFFAHGLGMLTMAAFLLPGMPGGPHADVASRATYVAAHPWIWRAGWSGWQLTALSDLILAIAVVRTSWIPKAPAVFTLFFTVLGLIPDQYGQAMWTWPGVHLAQTAGSDNYFAFETRVFRYIAGLGTIGYLIAALGWTWCFAAAKTWDRVLTKLSFATWGVFGLSTILIFITLPTWVSKITSAGNAIAFVVLMLWLVLVTEKVLRRSRPTTPHGHWATWRDPSSGMLPRACELIANSRFARLIGEYLPAMGMSSDITDVIYMNYLVPAERVRLLVPHGLLLQLVGPENRHAVFSVLTYRHGHFAPTIFGRFRRWWPSPIQSNWRIYVTDPRTGKTGVHFTTTAITSRPHALATRLLSEGVPMHILSAASLEKDDAGNIEIHLDPGNGTGPDLHGKFATITEPTLPEDWMSSFGSWMEMVAYCVPQDRALAAQPWYGRIARQEISLGIPLESCKPQAADFQSNSALEIVGEAECVCFRVDRVNFSFLREVFDAE